MWRCSGTRAGRASTGPDAAPIAPLPARHRVDLHVTYTALVRIIRIMIRMMRGASFFFF